ncbi:MAG: DUF1080 domain-containing protein [Opitutaceae bacterium]|jgi:hypothetical protein|nr:DUF1080 domain-containing protein [Opitutaceae bacterium]
MKLIPFLKTAALGALLAAGGLTVSAACGHCGDGAAAFAGSRWALTLPGGGIGWLGLTQNERGGLDALLLWSGGHPRPAPVTLKDGALVLTREFKRGNQTFSDEIAAKIENRDTLALTVRHLDAAGAEVRKPETFSGKRIPPLPPRPDLAKVKFGAPVRLIGDTLDNWAVMNSKAYNGWTLKDGVLSNRVTQPDGTKKHGANLRTKAADFEDFRISFEVNMPPKSNSGVYLRGIYEIQMADTHDQPPGYLNMGALYGRIAPSAAVEKAPGEWQTVEATLVDRHLTVVLNGATIIDNQPVLGCTGGALTSDEFAPGPVYLQGDHSDAHYRNMIVRPVLKE